VNLKKRMAHMDGKPFVEVFARGKLYGSAKILCDAQRCFGLLVELIHLRTFKYIQLRTPSDMGTRRTAGNSRLEQEPGKFCNALRPHTE